MGKSINEWSREIGAWGQRKGWDKPPLCAVKANPPGIALPGVKVVPPSSGGRWAEPFDVDTNAVLAKIALCHTELSEAVEAVRDGKYVAYVKDGKPEGVVVELADAVIRIMHLCDLLGLDLEEAMEQKMAANEKREYRHGNRLA